MPFENFWEPRGFYTKFWGQVSNREIESKNTVFSNDTRSTKCLYQIFDGTEIDTFIFNKDDITKIASNDIGMGFYLKNLLVVLVSPKPEIQKAYQQYISTCQRTNITWKFHICDTLDQAREWLEQSGRYELRDQRSRNNPERRYQNPTIATPLKNEANSPFFT